MRIFLSVILLSASCMANGLDGPTSSKAAAAGISNAVCQIAYDTMGSCEMERCDVPQPCATEADHDCDGVIDYGSPAFDNCTYFCNPGQENADGDYMGDACDPCINDPSNDIDKDGVCGDVDNCVAHPNVAQVDTDSDGVGDACDQFNGPEADPEERPAGWPDVNCNGIARPAEGTCTGLAANLLGLVIVCSSLLADDVPCDGYVDGTGGANTPAVCNAAIAHDLDLDGWGAACDNCPSIYNPSQANADMDGLGDACDQ